MTRPNSTNFRLSGGNPNTDPALSLGGQQGGNPGNLQHTVVPTTTALTGEHKIIDTAAIGDDDHTGKWVVLYTSDDPNPPFIQVTRFTDFDTVTGTYTLEAPLERDFPTGENGTRGRFVSHNVASDTQHPGTLFGEPTDEQAANGAEIYRCIFVSFFEPGLDLTRVHFYIDGEFSQIPTNERYEIVCDGEIKGTIVEILADEEDVPAIGELNFGSTAAKFSAPTIGEDASGSLFVRDQPTHPHMSSLTKDSAEQTAIWIKRIIDPQLGRANGDGVLAITCEGISDTDVIGPIRAVGLFPILSAGFAHSATVRPDRGKPPVGVDRIIGEVIDTTGLPATNDTAKSPIAPGTLRVLFDDGSGDPDLLELGTHYSLDEAIGRITWIGPHPLATTGYSGDYEVARSGVFDNELDVQAGQRVVAQINAAATGVPAADVSVGWELTGLGSIFEPGEFTDALGVARGVYTATKDDADDGALVSIEARVY